MKKKDNPVVAVLKKYDYVNKTYPLRTRAITTGTIYYNKFFKINISFNFYCDMLKTFLKIILSYPCIFKTLKNKSVK